MPRNLYLNVGICLYMDVCIYCSNVYVCVDMCMSLCTYVYIYTKSKFSYGKDLCALKKHLENIC
jgi:hypothetical protein